MKIITKTQYLLLALLTGLLALNAAMAMQPMSDEEMGAVSGQALLMMDMREGEGVSKDLNFYRAGLDAVVELNANFEKLQLGCGGVNGPGCDIDIDHLSLSGPESCFAGAGGRPGCDAILTRPFFEFAIKNDDTPHREIVGFRLSSENAEGMLTAGQNTDAPNGINVLSGYMRTTQITGTAQTQAVTFAGPSDPCRSNPQSCGVSSYTGNLDIRAYLSIALTADLIARTQGGTGTGISLPSMSVDFSSGPEGALVYGNRETSTSVQVTGDIPTISFPDSDLVAQVASCSGSACFLVPEDDLDVYTTGGGMENLGLVTNFTQNLGFIHRINVNSPFSLSMQSESVWWPDANEENIALPGWWMAFEDPVDLGHLEPSQQVDISPTFPQLSTVVKNYFEDNRLDLGIGHGWSALTGGYMNVTMPMMNVDGTTVSLDLTDLPLSDAAQSVTPNCWGDAKFC